MTPHAAPHEPPPAAAEASAAEREAARRVLRIRLLRDLVSNGLYRIPTDALAERLLPIVKSERG